MGLGFGIHSASSVAHCQDNVIPWHKVDRLAGERVIELDMTRLKSELAAPRHGVPSVNDQIHDHLLDLSRIGSHRSQIGFGMDHEINILADQATHHLVDVCHRRIEVQHLGLKHLLAAKC